MKQLALYSSLLLMTSCAPINFYQLHKISAESGTLTDNNIVFEGEDFKILYNFWDEGGDAGFYFYNKSDTDIQIDLTKSFFVLNDVSYEYFQNRSFTESESKESSTSANSYSYFHGRSVKVSNTASSTATFGQKTNITIPQKSMTKISEFHVSNARYISCELIKYPKTKDIKTIKFDNLNSPFKFYNLISYTLRGETKRLENKFFVSELTNLPESAALKTNDRSPCGRKLDVPIKAFKDIAPDKFYVKYVREE
jgi:hypothetical protein